MFVAQQNKRIKKELTEINSIIDYSSTSSSNDSTLQRTSVRSSNGNPQSSGVYVSSSSSSSSSVNSYININNDDDEEKDFQDFFDSMDDPEAFNI